MVRQLNTRQLQIKEVSEDFYRIEIAMHPEDEYDRERILPLMFAQWIEPTKTLVFAHLAYEKYKFTTQSDTSKYDSYRHIEDVEIETKEFENKDAAMTYLLQLHLLEMI